MIKLLACAIIFAGITIITSEWRRKKMVIQAESRLDDSKLKNEELMFKGCKILQDNENMDIEEDIRNQGRNYDN